MMGVAQIRRRLPWLLSASGTMIVLVTVYPTVFVLSRNWYALSAWQCLWLLAVSLLAGFTLWGILEAAFRAAGWRPSQEPTSREEPARAIAFGLLCAGVIYFLLIATLRHAISNGVLLVLGYAALAAIFTWCCRRGLQRAANAFVAALIGVAASGWLLDATNAQPPEMMGAHADFENAKFRKKPNIYLFIYDAYGSEDVYKKVFNLDNSAHYAELRRRDFKVISTFSNYDSTWQTTISTFLGAHHYYRSETGNADTQFGRPMMAGLTHNPVLHTLRENGFSLQYVHGVDYFVNETGLIDYVYPQAPVHSALRVFGNPMLNGISGRTWRASIEAHKAVLFSRIQPPAEQTNRPWFTFAHVNLPAHGPGLPWLKLNRFEQVFRDRTLQANRHMLETVDRIKVADPQAIIIVFGDHGAMRYNRIWDSGEPNAAFQKAGVGTDVVTLDRFGVMIAIHSAGLCDDYVYATMTPVNIMRSVFACLAGDRKLLDGKAADISLFGRTKQGLHLVAQDGVPRPSWELYEPPN
jgi:hypothetical protein